MNTFTFCFVIRIGHPHGGLDGDLGEGRSGLLESGFLVGVSEAVQVSLVERTTDELQAGG